MLEDTNNIIEFKSFFLFYENLYRRLFSTINHLIDENTFDISLTKDMIIDFTDMYSYYIISKKILKREDSNKSQHETSEEIKKKLNDFDTFTKELNSYPSKRYLKIRQIFIEKNNDFSKLSYEDWIYMIKEYYNFFNATIQILNKFITIASVNGFLPIIKSAKSMKSIGFANYKSFFVELENLKLKLSETTTTITLTNVIKSRRAIYSTLVIFSPYFKKRELFDEFALLLNFEFLKEEKITKDYFKAYSYTTLPEELDNKLKTNIINPLKRNVSLIKRYMSYEFGEIDMSPRLKKKYSYDPTWV